MDNFTEAYQKAREVSAQQQFGGEWNALLKEKLRLQSFYSRTGFSRSNAKAPAKLREQLTKGVKDKLTESDQLFQAASNDKSGGSLIDRAATLKFTRHLYHVAARGGQDVWVYAPPQSDATWVFDEITGDEATIKARLARNDEIFSQEQRKWMSTSLMLARKISEDCKHKLAGGIFSGVKSSTKDMVKRWFADEDTTDEDVTKIMQTLLTGFKQIAKSCNTSSLVFTDYPDWRAQRDKYFGAAFRGGEGGGFPVVYLEGAFTRLTGNSGQAWLCAETIIHELSHHDLSTQDHRYDHHGLKPNKTAFSAAKAIENADSWGYFALDLAGYLSKSDFAKVYK